MEKNAKNFAIWTALHSEIYFFTKEIGHFGELRFSREQADAAKSFAVQHEIPINRHYIMPTDDIKAAILKVGIDWGHTEAPKSDSISEFNGTDNDPLYVDVVTGTLQLIDGTKIEYIAKCRLHYDQFEAFRKFFLE